MSNLPDKPVALRLLGGFELAVDGRLSALRARKSKAVLSRLALDPNHARGRDELATLLWPDASESSARQSLRQALTDIRRALGERDDALVAGSDRVALRAEMVRIDALEFERRSTHIDLATFNRLHAGEVLEGIDVRVDAFEHWLNEQRSRFGDIAKQILRRIATESEARDDDEQAMQAYRRLLNLDVTDESVYRELMQLHISRGEDAAAIKLYLTCKAALERELGVPPEQATTSLYDGLMHHRQSRASEPARSRSDPQAADTATDDPKQLRPVTILAMRLHVAGTDPEGEDAHWQRIVASAEPLIRRFGGELIFRRGLVGVGAFGLRHAHGTEADRARLAAVDLSAQHRALSIGLAAGQVLVKTADEEVTGAPVSHALDVAARAPQGEIWMHASARSSFRVAVATRPQGVDAFALLQSEPAASKRPLVGRDLQLRQFIASLDACRSVGGGHSLLIRGEAGIGKSRLVSECRRVAAAEQVPVHDVQILDFGSERGNDPLAQLMRSLCRISGPETSAAQLSSHGVAEPLIPFALDMLGEDLCGAQAELVGNVPSPERVERRVQVLDALLSHAAEDGSLVIVVEDVHWADRMMLQVLARLVVRMPDIGALLIMTTRLEGEPLDPGWRRATQGAPLVTIDLGPLREAELRQLADQFGHHSSRTDSVVRRCGGNPLFLEQLMSMPGPTDELPDTVQSLAAARLDALSAPARATAQAASVLGQRFSEQALRALLPHPEFEEVLASGLIHAGPPHHRFHHALMQEGIYRSLLAADRERLHAAAAEFYRASDPLLFAQHLERARHPAAPQASLQAARFLQSQNRPGLALDLAQELMERHPVMTPQAQLLIAELHITLGSPADAVTQLSGTDGTGADVPESAQQHLLLGIAHNMLDNSDLAITHLRQAIALAGDDHALLADAQLELGNALFPTGQTEACLTAHRASFEHASHLDDAYRTSRALGGLADAYYQQGRLRSAAESFGAAVELAESGGHLSIVPANKAMHAYTRLFINEAGAAMGDLQAALSLAHNNGNLRHACLAHNLFGVVCPYTGDVERGLFHAREGIRLAELIGSRRFLADCHAQVGQLLWCQGELAAGAAEIALAEALLGEDLLPFGGANTSALAACCSSTARHMHRHLDIGAQRLTDNALSHCHLFYYAMGMQACLQFDDADRALSLAAGLAAYTEREPLPWADYLIRRTRLLAGIVPDPDKERRALRAIAERAPFALTV